TKPIDLDLVSIGRINLARGQQFVGRRVARSKIVAGFCWGHEREAARDHCQSRTQFHRNSRSYHDWTEMGAARLGTLFFARGSGGRLETNRQRTRRFSACPVSGAALL